MMFYLGELNERQKSIILEALRRCDFDWHRLETGLRDSTGKDLIPVDFRDLSRFGKRAHGDHPVTHIPEGHLIAHRGRVLGLAWYNGRVTLDITLESQPELAGEVFLSEGAHMVDFFWFTEGHRRLIDDLFHPSGLDEHDWFDNPSYWSDIGEAWMGIFVLGWSDYVMTLTGFVHHPTRAIAQEIRRSIEDVEEPPEEPPPPIPPPEPPLPEPEEPGDVLVPPEETPWEWLSRIWRQIVEFIRSLIGRG